MRLASRLLLFLSFARLEVAADPPPLSHPLASGPTTLPASGEGEVIILYEATRPLARSYDGHPWELTQGSGQAAAAAAASASAPTFVDLTCEYPSACTATIPDNGRTYQIEWTAAVSDDGRAVTARFLTQATFVRAAPYRATPCPPHRTAPSAPAVPAAPAAPYHARRTVPLHAAASAAPTTPARRLAGADAR